MDTQAIRQTINEYVAMADKIMDGGDSYDGADGARYMLEVCAIAIGLLNEVEDLQLHLQTLVSEGPKDNLL